MKVAVTADVHLKTKSETPERYNALEDILNKCLEQDIDNIIIAGDLFDQETNNYGDFEKLCLKKNSST